MKNRFISQSSVNFWPHCDNSNFFKYIHFLLSLKLMIQTKTWKPVTNEFSSEFLLFQFQNTVVIIASYILAIMMAINYVHITCNSFLILMTTIQTWTKFRSLWCQNVVRSRSKWVSVEYIDVTKAKQGFASHAESFLHDVTHHFTPKLFSWRKLQKFGDLNCSHMFVLKDC